MSIKKVNSRHRRMMAALVLEGKRPCEVAIEFGITESNLSILRRSPLWMSEEEAMRKEMIDMYKTSITRLVPKALTVQENLLESEDERIRQASAKDLLNRAGLNGDIVSSGEGRAVVRIVLED